MLDQSESLGNVGGGDANGGGGGDTADAFGDGVRDIYSAFKKKKTEVAQTTGICCYRYFPRRIFTKLPEN